MVFKTFDEFLAESLDINSDLHKVYLTINPDSGQRWWTYKGFAGSNFFQQINLENYKDLEIDPDFPVLNYNSEVTNTLLEEGLIKKENIYNLPEIAKSSGDKTKFHRLFEDDSNLPKTVFDKKEAIEKLKFPIIAKPAEGHSGIGIQVFKTEEDLKSTKSKFDLFSEFVDKKSEHRFFLFNKEPFFWMQREPLNDKAKSGDGEGKEEMNFKYIKRDPNQMGGNYRDLISRFAEKMQLPFICFDVMESVNGKLYIIESNSQPGVPYDSTVELYKKIFNDYFKRDIKEKDLKELNKFSKYLDKKTLQLDPERFEIKKN